MKNYDSLFVKFKMLKANNWNELAFVKSVRLVINVWIIYGNGIVRFMMYSLLSKLLVN